MKFILALLGALLLAPLTAHACFTGTPEVYCGGEGVSIGKTPSRAFKSASGGIRSRAVQSALRQVQRRCSGYRLISGYRNTYIAGTRRKSLHSYGLAADFSVHNYSCALRVLSRIQGIGYSRDGSRCRHIHVSDGRGVGRSEPRGFRHGRC